MNNTTLYANNNINNEYDKQKGKNEKSMNNHTDKDNNNNNNDNNNISRIREELSRRRKSRLQSNKLSNTDNISLSSLSTSEWVARSREIGIKKSQMKLKNQENDEKSQ